jgi:NAD(P)-dependent dehydrogenase (short-subunit alcohol dehydrogenase family)
VKKFARKNVTGVQGDVSNMVDLDRLFGIIQNEKGRLDILFANAGIGGFAPLGSITDESFDNLFNTNVKGTLFTVQKALPILTNGGSIVLNASNATIRGIANNSLYSATKAAVPSFARCWTVDLKDRHIRVNTISSGATDTPFLREFMNKEEQAKAFFSALIVATPMNRLASTDEIAKAVVFLASDDSSYITN